MLRCSLLLGALSLAGASSAPAAPPVRSVLATLGARNALVQPATYVSFNLDWHYDGEEYPAWRGCSVANMSLSEPNLVFLAKSLAPAVLRVGGSEGDLVVYETPTSPCPPDPNRTLFCLTMARWAEINAFAAATGNKVAFGLNAMSGRTNKTCPHCPWDPTNARDFLQYSQAQGITPAFFEFGNELTPYVAWEQYAKDVLVLRGLLDSVWPDAATRPKLVSNDANPDSAYLQNLLNATKGAIDVATWHLYIGYGLDPLLETHAWSASFMDKISSTAAGMVQGIKAAGFEGETQTIIGGNYELVNKTTRTPNPDWYVARLWKDAMGPASFAASSNDSDVRVYAHCAPAGGVTVAYINFSGNTTAALQVAGGAQGPLPGSRRLLRALSSRDNATVTLNGRDLVYVPGSGALPPLEPAADAGNGPLLLPPHTLGFVTFPDATAYDC